MLAFLTGIATFVANLGANACLFLWVDEPECPKSLIK